MRLEEKSSYLSTSRLILIEWLVKMNRRARTWFLRAFFAAIWEKLRNWTGLGSGGKVYEEKMRNRKMPLRVLCMQRSMKRDNQKLS